MRVLPFYLIIITLFSCSQKKVSFLNDDALPAQLIQLNNNRDTMVKTANGAMLQISKGSFSGGDQVTIEVKEAYSMEAIIKGGLTTQFNGRPLSSGGMIYVNTKDDGIRLVKPLRISVPTKNYDGAMQLFKGEKQDGKINCKEPQPLNDSLQEYFSDGNAIFKSNCATCHAYDKTMTGPAMKGLESRGPWNNRNQLYAFTHNPGGYIPKTCYTKKLVQQFGQIMPSFPQLANADLKKVYDYIRHKDIVNQVDLLNRYTASPCDDSCYRFDSIRYNLEDKITQLSDKRNGLIDSNGSRINYERLDSTGSSKMNKSGDQTGTVEKVTPEDYKAVYYRFDITSLGWYNIDKLKDLREDEYINLKLQVDDLLSSEWDVFIAVPEEKMFDRGGHLDDANYYGFYTHDGKTPLPAGKEVILFVLGEVDGKVAFDYIKIITSADNIINLHPKLSTKDAFNEAVKRLVLPGVTINAADSKNADAIRKVDVIIKMNKERMEAFRPKTCDCNCRVVTDTTRRPSPSGDSTALKY